MATESVKYIHVVQRDKEAQMKRMPIICVMILLFLACVRPTAHAAEPVLTGAERQKLAKLVNDLDSDDPETLDLALQGLLAMGPKADSALDRLTEMLADARRFTYPTVRYRSLSRTFQVNVSVVGGLRSIGPKAVPALVTALKNEDEKVRLPAIQAIVELRHPAKLEVWLEAVKDSNPYVQIYAARELGKSKTPAANDALCKVLQVEDMEVRIEVVKALGQIGDEKAIGPLMDVLDGQVNMKLESAVGTALGTFGEPAVKVLLEKIDSFDENRRRMIGLAIRELDALETRPLLLECLKSEHWQVRGAAIGALARLKTPESLRIVTDAIEDPQWSVRSGAVNLLGKLADDKSAGAIRAILLKMAENDPNANVRDNALWTLYSFPGIPTNDYWNTLEGALDDESPRVRATAASSCIKYPNARFAARLKELLNDPNVSVRAESAAALGRINARDAVPDLILLLDDEDLRCGLAASFSLGKLGTDEAVAALVAKLRDTKSDGQRRKFALNGLLSTTNPKAIEPLRAALEDQLFSSHHLEIKNALRKLGKE